MTKDLQPFKVDRLQAIEELGAFRKLLDGSPSKILNEREHILPFFRKNQHLAAMIGAANSKISRFDRIGFEFSIQGDFNCDLVVGDSVKHQYCFVEFENAAPNSVFSRKLGKSTPEWGSRFEHGYSQIIDWFRALHGMEGTPKYQQMFGMNEIHFLGMLVIGRRDFMDQDQISRLEWRREHVTVFSKKINCITFDELYDDLRFRLEEYA